jgi:hypothetical protein
MLRAIAGLLYEQVLQTWKAILCAVAIVLLRPGIMSDVFEFIDNITDVRLKVE